MPSAVRPNMSMGASCWCQQVAATLALLVLLVLQGAPHAQVYGALLTLDPSEAHLQPVGGQGQSHGGGAGGPYYLLEPASFKEVLGADYNWSMQNIPLFERCP